IDAIRYSFFDWDGASPSMNFVGLENYVQLTKDTIFLKALGHNLLWVVLSLTLMAVPTLVLAVLISSEKKGKMFFRAGFYLPINVFLRSIGLESLAKNWLGEPFFVIPALVIASTWAFYGLYLILFLAGLQSVDYSVYEAADIDGAGPISKFWHITIPSLRNTLN